MSEESYSHENVTLCIITVAYNNPDDLKRTFASVQKQCTQPDSHIVVAAGFRQNEKEKIQKSFSAPFRHFFFDIDNSLYDAMNIGLSHSSGDAVLFLNAGDTLYSFDSIKNIKRYFVLGRCLLLTTILQYETDLYVRSPVLYENKIIQTPGHQGFVAPLPMAKKYLFQHKKKPISADVGWMAAIHRDCGSVTSNKIVSKFQLGGLSNRPTLNSCIIRMKDGGVQSLLKEIVRFSIFVLFGPRLAYRLLYFKKYERKSKNND